MFQGLSRKTAGGDTLSTQSSVPLRVSDSGKTVDAGRRRWQGCVDPAKSRRAVPAKCMPGIGSMWVRDGHDSAAPGVLPRRGGPAAKNRYIYIEGARASGQICRMVESHVTS
ncbi:hypothetical protein BGLA2_1180020 [Burkholderia gladioli]|nr:hypothetical protein BGLA2_1180020 [Burkholderia gladioli]